MGKIFSKKNSLIVSLSSIIILISSAVVAELILRNTSNDYQKKSNFLSKNGHKIETLILGNSHTLNGINPSLLPNSYNAAHSAQPFEYDYKIIEKYQKKLSHLKTVILSVSYFSYTLNFKEGRLKNRIKDYNVYYGINTGEHSLKNNFEIFHQSIGLNFQKWKNNQINPTDEIHVNENGSPKNRKEFNLKKYYSSETVKKHTYPFNKLVIEENIYYLNKILSFAKAKNIQIIMVSTPTSATYLKNVDQRQYKHWQETTNKFQSKYSNCKWINYFEHSEKFNETDFVDADHLNQLGADKLTQFIKHQLKL